MPALVLTVSSLPFHQPRNSPIVTSQHLQPVASSSRRRAYCSPLPFTVAQVFQPREHWPIQVTREDQNLENEGQDSVARILRRFDRNSREVIMYANDIMIPGKASKFSWYED
ncbi:hypothetical protein O181_013147 [Austropuccinia psidii MF-1]|uniref:Uncharacterized protein n=1 Tax=Austropuccinia psidii MF-1 TaxID=1389203 RepID=A0A9Q3BZ22_9BASI|nr:hypothetical protein [Austropuccinia psidii MF-1]